MGKWPHGKVQYKKEYIQWRYVIKMLSWGPYYYIILHYKAVIRIFLHIEKNRRSTVWINKLMYLRHSFRCHFEKVYWISSVIFTFMTHSQQALTMSIQENLCLRWQVCAAMSVCECIRVPMSSRALHSRSKMSFDLSPRWPIKRWGG